MTTRNEILDRKLSAAVEARDRALDALEVAKHHLKYAQEQVDSAEALVKAEFALCRALTAAMEAPDP